MENNEIVFGTWSRVKTIGTGTDGRVELISRVGVNGKREYSILKTMFVHPERSNGRDFNRITPLDRKQSEDCLERAKRIGKCIKAAMDHDGGKHFIKYEQCDCKKTEDGGYIIYTRLEFAKSLREVMAKSKITLDDAVMVGIQVCKGLIRSAEMSYVYWNIKPENVLVDSNGRCKLGDFGSFSELTPIKSSPAYTESTHYMAPEFYQSGKVNVTCGTYALGVLLYVLVNGGKLPFCAELTPRGIDEANKKRLSGAEFIKPEGCSDELFEIIQKACAFDPRRRYTNPVQMLNDLKSVRKGEKKSAPVYDDVYSTSQQRPRVARPAVHDPAYYVPKPQDVGSPKSGRLNLDDILASIYANKEPQQPQPAAPVYEEPAPQYAPVEPEEPAETVYDDDEPTYVDSASVEEKQGKIKVPFYDRFEYFKGKVSEQARKIVKKEGTQESVIDINSEEQNVASSNKKKMIIVAALVVLVIILIVFSGVARSNRDTQGEIDPQASVSSSQPADENASTSDAAASSDANASSDAAPSDDSASSSSAPVSIENNAQTPSESVPDSTAGQSEVPSLEQDATMQNADSQPMVNQISNN